MTANCYDCAHCATRDVFNGFCEVNFKNVPLDEKKKCHAFSFRDKCKNCAQYEETGRMIGVCNEANKIPTYPDLFGCMNYKRA